MELTDRELKILMLGVKVALDTYVDMDTVPDDTNVAFHLYPVHRAMSYGEEYLPSDGAIEITRKIIQEVAAKRAAMEEQE